MIDGTSETVHHSGMGFESSNGAVDSIPWIPAYAEPGPWAMPVSDDD